MVKGQTACAKLLKVLQRSWSHTVFCQINAPGAVAEDKPLSLSDLNRIDRANTLRVHAENIVRIGLVVSEI